MPELTKTENVEFVVLRDSREENTVAVVQAVVAPELADDVMLRDAIRRAVTVWIKTTDGGRAAYEATCGDFNVGDFETYRDTKLLKLLVNEGVFSIDVTCMSSEDCGEWMFDDRLVDNAAVEE